LASPKKISEGKKEKKHRKQKTAAQILTILAFNANLFKTIKQQANNNELEYHFLNGVPRKTFEFEQKKVNFFFISRKRRGKNAFHTCCLPVRNTQNDC